MTRRTWILVLALAGCSAQTQGDKGAAETPSKGLGTQYRSAVGWTDETDGPQLTFIYMSASGSSENPRPFPLIYSSDPDNAYFHREYTPNKTARRLYREQMARIASDLGGGDSKNARRRKRAKVTVRRLYRKEMARFLGELEASGLNDLPWEPFGFRKKIGPRRGFTTARRSRS